MSIKCALYCRVSTNDQTTQNQLNILREVAQRRGFIIVSEFTDKGKSGAYGRDKRQSYDILIKGAIRRDFDIILVWSVCRLGRSLQELVSFLNEMQRVKCDLYIHQSGIDTGTPSGKMMFQMLGVFAEFEREIIRERIKAGQQRAVKNGKKLGRKSNMNEGMKSAIKVMREQGWGIRKIARELQIGTQTVYQHI